MSTITDLQGSTPVTTAGAAAIINNNFDNLNTDKIETSYLDTDTTLSANSDSKIATQKAVKAYVDSGGNQNASTTQAGIVQEASQAQVDAGTAAGSTTARLFLNPSTVSASETTAGLVEEATDAEVAAGTATGGTNRKLFVTPAKLATYITNFIATYITPISNSLVKFIGVGQSSNTSYINFQIPFGAAAATFGWTSVGSPTYSQFELVTGSATGVYKPLGINLDTGVTYNWSNTKIKILEWTAKINSDTSTATSFMGFTSDGTAGFDWDSSSRYIVGFGTKADGTWACVTGNSTTSTKTVITTPTAAKHTFRVEYNSSSEAKFYIDGVLVSTNTTNLPTSSGDNIGISFTNGTSSIIIGAISAINVAIQK